MRVVKRSGVPGCESVRSVLQHVALHDFDMTQFQQFVCTFATFAMSDQCGTTHSAGSGAARWGLRSGHTLTALRSVALESADGQNPDSQCTVLICGGAVQQPQDQDQHEVVVEPCSQFRDEAVGWNSGTVVGRLSDSAEYRGHSAVVVNGNIVLFGGVDQNSKPTNSVRVQSLDSPRKTGTVVETLGLKPTPRGQHAAAAVTWCGKSLMIIHGGVDANGTYLLDLCALDLDSMRWLSVGIQSGLDTDYAQSGVPTGRAGHTLSHWGEKLVAFGGGWVDRDSRWCTTAELWALEPMSHGSSAADCEVCLRWTLVPTGHREDTFSVPLTEPSPRAFHVAVELPAFLTTESGEEVCSSVLFLGGTSSSGKCLSDAWLLSGSGMAQWVVVGNSPGLVPRARAKHAAALLGCRRARPGRPNFEAEILVYGGEYGDTSGDQIALGDGWELSLRQSEDGSVVCRWATSLSEEDGTPLASPEHTRAVSACLVGGATDGIGFDFYTQALARGPQAWLAADMVCGDRIPRGIVYALGRTFERLDRVASCTHVVTRRIQCDIRAKGLKSVVDTALIHRIDTFVNCIGTFTKCRVDHVVLDALNDHFLVNVTANILLTQTVLGHLSPRFAQILQCGSTLALDAKPGCVDSSPWKSERLSSMLPHAYINILPSQLLAPMRD